MTPPTTRAASVGRRRLGVVIVIGLGLLFGISAFSLVQAVTTRHRTTPIYVPPVVAGQVLWGYCSGGFYARLGEAVVLTSTGHCTSEGTVAYAPDGITIRGIFGRAARDATCPYPGHWCASSDLNYLVVAADQVPWGHLNEVDLGTAGYRVIPPGTRPLACPDIAIGDEVEINGRDIYRRGTVSEKGENLKPADEDGAFFPCMVAASVEVGGGDSGGAVLVRGIPAGVSSRSFGGSLGFTPLAEGLKQLGLELCTAPDCGLVRPGPDQDGATPAAG